MWHRAPLYMLGPLWLACVPASPLSRQTILNHPKVSLEILKPQVVEQSAAIEPAWVRTPQRTEVAGVAFVGQAFAPSQDEAAKQAQRDLLSAISNFIAVEVESEFASRETSSRRGDDETQTQDVTSVVRTSSAARLESIAADAFYWEKVVASPLTPGNVSFRYYVHARVPRGEIMRARLAKQLARQRESGRKMLVVLPFRPLAEAPETAGLTHGLLEELCRRLGASAGLYVGDPSLVAALVAGKSSEAEALETVQDALLPDLVLGGSYQLHANRLRVTYTLYEATSSKTLSTRSLTRPYGELFALQDELVTAVGQDVGAHAQGKEGKEPAPSTPPTPRGGLRASEHYRRAYSFFEAGRNEKALGALRDAIATAPDYAAAYFRMGRVFERMGRYGRIPFAAPGARDPAEAPPTLCTPWSEISSMDLKTFLRAREVPLGAAEPTWQKEAANVDHVFSALFYVLDGGKVPGVDGPAAPVSAIDAYWRAFALAWRQSDTTLTRELKLALADLAVRVDRLEAAERLYRLLLAEATTRGDLHLASLTRYGLGVVLVRRGAYQEARHELIAALKLRVLLGEKPFILEILNELGNLAVIVDQYGEAERRFVMASRIAEELDNDYFRAVLANNLGVLAYMLGDTPRALELFERAWDFLARIDEAEGRISAALNIGFASGVRGDLERARAYLRMAELVVHATGQEGRLASAYAHQGFQEALAGETLAALRALLRSWSISFRFGRAVQDLRARNNLAVADFDAFAADPRWPSDRERIACLRRVTGELAAQAQGTPHSLRRVTALNAAVVGALGP